LGNPLLVTEDVRAPGAYWQLGVRYATMAGFSYFYFGQATQVLVTENLNKASGVTGFVLLRLGCFSITINELITVLVALSAYSTIPVLFLHPSFAISMST